MGVKESISDNLRVMKRDVKLILKNKFLYVGLALVLFGNWLNHYSQRYLHNRIVSGETIPILTDLIVDNLPFYEISFIYDWFSLFGSIIFILYIIYKKKYKEIPYFLIMLGILYIFRGVFIVLTPFGHPRNGVPTNSCFGGFSKYETGVYPSGHTGGAFLYSLMARGIFRKILLFITVVIIIALLFARGHYSIDILSGLIFAYAIYAFGEKYIKQKVVSRH